MKEFSGSSHLVILKRKNCHNRGPNPRQMFHCGRVIVNVSACHQRKRKSRYLCLIL